jgi:RNA polymerase sigma-70 factor (ECF subfamily)
MTRQTALPRHDILATLPHLRRYAGVLAGKPQEADRLVLETLEQARQGPLQESAGTSLRTRLFALLHELYSRHAASDPLRSLPATMDALPALASSPGKPSELLIQFGKLPPEEREVLLLVAVERMRYEEIAELLQVPVSTVIARLKRARDLMRAESDSYPQGWQSQDPPVKR